MVRRERAEIDEWKTETELGAEYRTFIHTLNRPWKPWKMGQSEELKWLKPFWWKRVKRLPLEIRKGKSKEAAERIKSQKVWRKQLEK